MDDNFVFQQYNALTHCVCNTVQMPQPVSFDFFFSGLWPQQSTAELPTDYKI